MSKKIPLNKINNGWVVCLICIPFFGALIIEPIFFIWFGNSIIPTILFYLCMNVVIIYQDQKQLELANIKIDNGLIWGAILVPVYTYLRGSAFNKKYNLGVQSQWVFICWMISFVIGILIS